MGVGYSRLWDERAEAEEVPGCRDVVAGLVPEVREPEQTIVSEIDGDEEQGIEHPQRDVAKRLPVVFYRSAWKGHALS